VNETSRVTGSRFGGVRLYWADEADSLTATKPAFRMVNLKMNKLTGLCYLTDEIMQDATALQAFVERAFASEFGWIIDNSILRGPGAGQPLGVLNSPALVTVSKETSQAAATICTDNIIKMYSRCSAPEKAVWVANIAAFPQLATLQVAIGTAGSLVGLLKEGVAGSPSGMGMLGRPLIWAEQSSALGDVGDIAFMDLSRYLLASKGGLQTAQSLHVRFIQDECVLRFIYRVDGQPDLASAITPAYGTATVSPFVVLQAR
jgi:HK97 family phage major capsid protein